MLFVLVLGAVSIRHYYKEHLRLSLTGHGLFRVNQEGPPDTI